MKSSQVITLKRVRKWTMNSFWAPEGKDYLNRWSGCYFASQVVPPRVILGSRTPHTLLSTSGPGIMWWSIQFDRVVRLIRVNKAYPGFPSPFTLFQAPRESGPLNWESANTKIKREETGERLFPFSRPPTFACHPLSRLPYYLSAWDRLLTVKHSIVLFPFSAGPNFTAIFYPVHVILSSLSTDICHADLFFAIMRISCSFLFMVQRVSFP